MSDKIAEIRARHEVDNRYRDGWHPGAHNDRATLLAEVDRQARHIDELRAKVDAEKSCACSYDAPGDVCSAHSPALMQERADNERLRAVISTLEIVGKAADDERQNMRKEVERLTGERNEARAEVERYTRSNIKPNYTRAQLDGAWEMGWGSPKWQDMDENPYRKRSKK